MAAIHFVNFVVRYIELSGLLPHDSFDSEMWKLLENFAGKGAEYFLSNESVQQRKGCSVKRKKG